MMLSLKQKTIIGVATIEAVLLILLIVTAINFMTEFNNEAMQKRATTAVQLFATTTQDAVLSYDLASLQSFSEQMLVNPDIVYARILDDSGHELASATLDNYGITEFVPDSLVTETNDGVFDVTAEIIAAETIYGSVQVGIEVSAIQKNMVRLKKNITLIALSEMLLVGLFSYFLGSYLTSQLRKLQRGANRVADAVSHGDFEHAKIDIGSRDELSEVANAFNMLVDSLKVEFNQRENYQHNLEDLNANLEQKVIKRTEVLQKQNALMEKTNKKLKMAQKQLLHAEKMSSIGQLAAGVAHEINNPVGYVLSNMQTMGEYLTAYQMALEELESKVMNNGLRADDFSHIKETHDLTFVTEDAVSLLEESQKGLSRVKEIVLGLKNFSHAGDDSFEKVDLNKCLTDTLGMVSNQLKYHCEIQSKLCEEAYVTGNSGRLCQVLTNLLVNAGHAIKEKGQILIKTLRKSGKVVVQIADNGCGIPEENIKSLFDPFFTTKPIGEGTGLGLAISYGIVKDHYGEIKVKSIEGKGTCFSLVFPEIDEEALIQEAK